MTRLLSILMCLNSVVLVATHGDEPGTDWHPHVLQLFSLEERDAAIQQLLKEARYPEDPAYTEHAAGKVKAVVLCPQSNGRPLVTVFAGSDHEPEDASPRSGHFIVIRSDGLILPFYHGANSLDGYFRDLNADGVVDYLDSWEIGYRDGMVSGLHLVPITEAFSPALVVYWQEGAYQWRLHQPDPDRIPTIRIGLEEETGFEPVAEYRWSREENQWLGPEGSPDAGFMRVDNTPDAVARRLIEAAAEDDANDPISPPAESDAE